MKTGLVVTFYSYKGGVGRTLALANVGALLAKWNFRVLCIDWDLEAPGLRRYFEDWITVKDSNGLVDLISDFAADKNPDWQHYITQVHFPETGHRLSLLHAGRDDESYVQRLQQIDWEGLYQQRNLGFWLENLRETWKDNYDFVLIDSRTGITDIGGICTIQMPDVLALVFTANWQSLQGVLDVALSAQKQRNDLPTDRAQLLCLPIPSRFEGRVEYRLAQKWLNRFAEKLSPLFANWMAAGIEPLDIIGQIKVPYVPYWSFGEKLPVVEEGTHDPESLGFSLETLAALIAHRLANSDMLVGDRDGFVHRVVPPPPPGIPAANRRPTGTFRGPLRVYVIYSELDDTSMLNEFAKSLKPLVDQQTIQIITHDSITPGQKWRAVVSERIDTSDVIVVLVTSNLADSDWATLELDRALQRADDLGVIVIPIWLEANTVVQKPYTSPTAPSLTYYYNSLLEHYGIPGRMPNHDLDENARAQACKTLVLTLREIAASRQSNRLADGYAAASSKP